MENCGEQVNITKVCKQYISAKYFVQNVKNMISISMERILEYRYKYRWTNIDLGDIGSIQMQHYY